MNKQFVKDFEFTGNALWTEFMIYLSKYKYNQCKAVKDFRE